MKKTCRKQTLRHNVLDLQFLGFFWVTKKKKAGWKSQAGIRCSICSISSSCVFNDNLQSMNHLQHMNGSIEKKSDIFTRKPENPPENPWFFPQKRCWPMGHRFFFLIAKAMGVSPAASGTLQPQGIQRVWGELEGFFLENLGQLVYPKDPCMEYLPTLGLF